MSGGIVESIRKLILRAFPELGGTLHTRIGEVVAIADAPEDEKATDRFRPRYAVDVQLLTPQGQPDAGMPVLERLPLTRWRENPARSSAAITCSGVALGSRRLMPS